MECEGDIFLIMWQLPYKKQEFSELSHESSGPMELWGALISDTFLLTNKGPPKSTSRQGSGAPNGLHTQQGLMPDLHE